MKVDKDLYRQLNETYRLTSVIVIYRMPDYMSLLQEFMWQTLDIPPKYPRVNKFLDYWETHIEAPIYKVEIANTEVLTPGNYEFISRYYEEVKK